MLTKLCEVLFKSHTGTFTTRQTITYSRSTMETLEKGVKYVRS